VDLPNEGDELSEGQKYGELESVKAVSDVYSPLSGEVLAVNDELNDEPSLINQDPYGKGWIVRIRMSDPSQVESLMSAEEYKAFLKEA